MTIRQIVIALIGFSLQNIFCPFGQAQTFRVMSFNILDGGSTRLDTLFYIINTQKADIVLVQESSNLDDRFLKKAAEYGFQLVQNDINKGIYQPAILSRFSIINHGDFFRAIHATIELPNGRHIKIFNSHWLPLNLNEERVYQTRHLVQDFLSIARENYPIITGGDLNV